MKDLLEKAEIAEVGQHLGTADDILKHESSQSLVAFLLKSYFSQQAEKVEQGSQNEERKARRQSQDGEEQDGDRKRSRRRRRRRKGKGGDEKSASGADRDDNEDSGSSAPAVQEGLRRVQVNIGFDDGFKGRGAVAKKITALAGLNDGIVSELEAKRHHAVLAATPEVAEMLVDRVDGAMLGRKTIEISVTD